MTPPIRTIAQFDTSIPDECAGKPDNILCGGQALAAAIGELLRDQGFSVEKPERGGWSWQFSARIVRDKVKTRLWFKVIQDDEATLIVEDLTFAIFARKDPTMLGKTLARLNDQLAADVRFSGVLWYTEAGYDGGRQRGAASPIPKNLGSASRAY